MDNNRTEIPPNLDADKKQMTLIVYILYACSFVFGISAIVAIVLNYVKKDDMQGTWLESHFRWQIRTFWFGLLWTVIGLITCFILIGFVILMANLVWFIYRLVKGIVNLLDNKPMPV